MKNILFIIVVLAIPLSCSPYAFGDDYENMSELDRLLPTNMKDVKAYRARLYTKAESNVNVKSNVSSKVVTNRQYGSMLKPVKSITIDLYQQVDVNTSVEQQLLNEIKVKLAQLAEVRTQVKPQYKVVVRQ